MTQCFEDEQSWPEKALLKLTQVSWVLADRRKWTFQEEQHGEERTTEKVADRLGAESRSTRVYGRMQGWRWRWRSRGRPLVGPHLDTTNYKEVIYCFIIHHGQRLETISMFHQRDWLNKWWSTKTRISRELQKKVDWILYGLICCDLQDWLSARCRTMSIIYVLEKVIDTCL